MNFLLRWGYERIIYDFLSWKFRPKFHLNKMKSRILKCSVYFVRSFLFLYAYVVVTFRGKCLHDLRVAYNKVDLLFAGEGLRTRFGQ